MTAVAAPANLNDVQEIENLVMSMNKDDNEKRILCMILAVKSKYFDILFNDVQYSSTSQEFVTTKEQHTGSQERQEEENFNQEKQEEEKFNQEKQEEEKFNQEKQEEEKFDQEKQEEEKFDQEKQDDIDKICEDYIIC
ncbi:unnamed protein product [Rotaria sordida]|uniref:Uncharacterized protein n=1 Tax=Rotaria sordida TaxID=392033 RepID=A0A818M043_9BILA|nr:unnamed protein product [Rotaria sordida]